MDIQKKQFIAYIFFYLPEKEEDFILATDVLILISYEDNVGDNCFFIGEVYQRIDGM